MESCPQRQLFFITSFDPIQSTGKIGLNGGFVNVRHVGEPDQRCLIAPSNKRLAPWCEQNREVLVIMLLDPVDEAFQRPSIHLVFLPGLNMFGERAVFTAVIAARERSPVQDREVHCSL